jgi:hypothetical protein
MFSHIPRLGAHSSVKCWLSAAGLSSGKIHLDSRALQNPDNRLTGLRVEGIYYAGDKQLDSFRHKLSKTF